VSEVAGLSAIAPLFVATFRDWVIIVMGICVAAFFFVGLVVTVVLGLLVRALLRKTSALLDDSVKPLLASAKDTADHVKGTTTYVSGATVTPIVRTYGVIAGVRRAVGVLAGLTGASNDGER
jgi:hypothetical protein